MLSKVSRFLLKSFHFRRLHKRYSFFSHATPYISNVTQQFRSSPILILRAWATCGSFDGKFASPLFLDQTKARRDEKIFSTPPTPFCL